MQREDTMDTRSGIRGLLLLVVALGLGTPARAIIIFGSPGQNLSAPTGALADSGWQWVGEWDANGFTAGGVAVSPTQFLTSSHLGGQVGNTFLLDGHTYTATQIDTIAGTDLEVVTVDGTFSSWAPLYTGGDELGKSLVTYGFGVKRSGEVKLGGQTKGWSWGTKIDGKSWGTGTVDAVGPYGTAQGFPGDKLGFAFQSTSHDSGIYSQHDSGGGVFINDGGVWKLAGINYIVDNAVYQFNASTGNYDVVKPVSLFDLTGYFYQDENNDFRPFSPDDRFFSFATRVSTYSDQLRALLVPEPSGLALAAVGSIVLGLAAARRRGRGRPAARG
jgi:hypothetical protein